MIIALVNELMTPISIVIITLNEAERIGNILRDLAQQSYQNFEVIVVDSNSEDNTCQIAAAIRCYRSPFALTHAACSKMAILIRAGNTCMPIYIVSLLAKSAITKSATSLGIIIPKKNSVGGDAIFCKVLGACPMLYRPLNSAGRFCIKAVIPSLKSSLVAICIW